MRLNKKFFDKLEKEIKKDFGPNCWSAIHGHRLKKFSPLCCVCQVWLAYYSLRDLYGIDYKGVYKGVKDKKIKK